MSNNKQLVVWETGPLAAKDDWIICPECDVEFNEHIAVWHHAGTSECPHTAGNAKHKYECCSKGCAELLATKRTVIALR